MFVASYVVDPAAPGRETVLQDFETGITSSTPDAQVRSSVVHGLPARTVSVPTTPPVTVIVWTHGLFLLTVYATDPAAGAELADMLVTANGGRV